LIIGITKDGGKRLNRNIHKLLKIRRYIKTCDFLIYENNSNALTKQVLADLKSEISGFDYLSEDLTQEQIAAICTTRNDAGKPCRIELIAYARNTLQAKAKEKQDQYDYILNIDLDVLLFNPLDALKSLVRFAHTPFDIITGYGMTKRIRYRDAYAFRSPEFPYGPEYMPEFWWTTVVHQIQGRYGRNKKLPVYSAFGGAALYTSKAYFAATYDCHPTPLFLKKQAELLAKSAPAAEQTAHAVTEPQPNTHNLAPIVCEHVPFHYALIDQGLDKIFVDTSWRFMFQD